MMTNQLVLANGQPKLDVTGKPLFHGDYITALRRRQIVNGVPLSIGKALPELCVVSGILTLSHVGPFIYNPQTNERYVLFDSTEIGLA